jgi:hypothetical protein
MTKRSLARAKGRPQKALLAYLTAPIGSKVRLTFPNATCAAENLRSAVYALRNDLLEAMPDAASIFWIPPAYSGQTTLLISRLEALTQTLFDRHTLIIHDGSLNRGTPLEMSIEQGDTPLPERRPISRSAYSPPAESEVDLAARIAEGEAIERQTQIDRALKAVRDYDNKKALGMDYMLPQPGGRGYEELETSRQLLSDNNITI